MQITINTPKNAIEAFRYIKQMNRVFIPDNGLLHFFRATTCEVCNCKAEEPNPVKVGATTLEASGKLHALIKKNIPNLKRVKEMPAELWANEYGEAVCEACE